eukprot:SAG31_NODE_42048_length_273_cov_0.839080_1_plen_58_part_01
MLKLVVVDVSCTNLLFQTSRTLTGPDMPSPSSDSGRVTLAGPPGVQVGGVHGGGTKGC